MPEFEWTHIFSQDEFKSGEVTSNYSCEWDVSQAQEGNYLRGVQGPWFTAIFKDISANLRKWWYNYNGIAEFAFKIYI